MDETTPGAGGGDGGVTEGAGAGGESLLTGAQPTQEAKADGQPDAKPAGEADAPESNAADGGEQADQDGAPESYAEFTAPEGVQFDQAAIDAFTPIAKDLGLTQAQAQRLVDVYAGQADRVAQGLQAKHAETVAGWQQEARADPDIGGAKLPETIAHGMRALDQFGSPELSTLMDQTGLGNHPAVIRFFAAVGQQVADDAIDPNPSPGGGRAEPRDAAAILYPNDKPKET